MAWILKDLGAKALVVYLASIAGVALAAGLALDWMLTESVLPSMTEHVHAAAGSALWGAVLIGVMTYAAVRRLQARFAPKAAAKSCCSSGEVSLTSSCCSSKPEPKQSCCQSSN